jgi:hypothetical protein
MAAHRTEPAEPRRWSAQVAKRAPALDLEPGLFTWSDPQRIATSLLHSAHISTRRKRSVYASAMAMLCLYINRAGRQLSPSQRQVLEAAKESLRRQAEGHPPRR